MRDIGRIAKLYRFSDYVFFTVPVTLFGYTLGVLASGGKIDPTKLIVIVLANLAAVGFAFVFNELEDNEDDGKKIDIRLAKRLSVASFAGALLFYYLLGQLVFLIGLSTLILGFLYSWKLVRLKSWPVVDIASHCLMLGGLLFLAGYYVSAGRLGQALILFLAITIGSIYGQLYNQVRDFKEDKNAKLNNTSIFVGKRLATMLMYIAALTTLIFAVYSFLASLLPLWFIPVGVILTLGQMSLFKPKLADRDKNSGVMIVASHYPLQVTMLILSVIYVFVI